MDIENIDPCQAEALKAVFERAHDPIVGIIEDILERHRKPQRTRSTGIRMGPQQPSCLGRQDPIFARQLAQRIADNSARLAETIERRSIEIANTGRPPRPYNRLSFFSSDRDPVSSE